MKKKSIKIYHILFLLIVLINFISADNAKIDINIDINNIASLNDLMNNGNLDPIIPYKEVSQVNNYIDKQTKLGRTIKLKWHIVNYEINENSYAGDMNGFHLFHLFEFTWYRLRTFVEYKEEDNNWTSMISIPTGFKCEPDSEAIIYSYGNVPVLISPTICPGGNCLCGGGEQQGKFQEELIQKIEKENYRISIIKYPVTKSVYLMINDSNLIGKKLELEGSFNLGDSAITTERKSIFFPFDKYSLNLIYSSYYDSKVNFHIKDIEDLNLKSEEEKDLLILKNKDEQINFLLIRKDPIKSIFWNSLIILVPFIIYISEKKWDLKRKTRIIVYVIAFIALILKIPRPLNVSTINLLNIIIWGFYILLILIIENILSKQSKHHTK
jgi:hypothetical protein